MSLDAALSRHDAARLIGCSTRSLDRLVAQGEGPPYCRIGSRRMVFRLADLNDWMAARRYQHRAGELAGRVAR
jgi:predicted DNA-binding transcriptional regulator AlpA